MTTNQPRAYAAAHFALELDGNKRDVGMFRSVEGGSIKADVMTYQNGASYERWRQLGKPKFEDIKLQVGMSMSRPFFEWIEAFFTGQTIRKNGAIVAADFNYAERARREFTEALIKELTFPKLDATDKNPAYMGVAMAVEGIVFKPGDGKKITNTNPTDTLRQQMWTACNFTFRLDGLSDQACKRVSKIDSFTVKQTILEYHTGAARAPIKCPSQIDFPQLSFYLPEADAEPFLKEFHLRAVKGEPSARRTGMIETFDHERRPLFTLSFKGADIVNVTPDKSDAGSEEIKQVKVEICTESMAFAYASPSTKPPA